MNDQSLMYIASWIPAGFLLVIAFFVFGLSNYFKNLRDKIQNNDFDLKNKDAGQILIQHLAELTVVLLLFEKLDSSSVIPKDTTAFWAVIQAYIVLLLLSASYYTYGKLIFMLMNNGFSEAKTFFILVLSAITISIFIIIG